jgi:hypothetical protein
MNTRRLTSRPVSIMLKLGYIIRLSRNHDIPQPDDHFCLDCAILFVFGLFLRFGMNNSIIFSWDFRLDFRFGCGFGFHNMAWFFFWINIRFVAARRIEICDEWNCPNMRFSQYPSCEAVYSVVFETAAEAICSCSQRLDCCQSGFHKERRAYARFLGDFCSSLLSTRSFSVTVDKSNLVYY